ncbi:hypothetical protein JYT21_00040 [bacterium AH-315-B15]|nr:hypothetical protein [bacterium AH-315-B15]
MKTRQSVLLMTSFLSLFLVYSCGGSEGEGDGTDSTQVETAEYDISVNWLPDDEVPRECEVIDAYLDCHQWTDANGKNYFLRSLGFPVETELRGTDGSPTETQLIYAYHYRETSDGIELVNEYRDSVVQCEFDIIMDHVKACYFITDLDEDDMGEITFMYRMQCTTDISPSTQVLKIIEGNDVYTITGRSLVFEEGGEYELGPEFDNAPEGFKEHAEGIWADFMDEMGAF